MIVGPLASYRDVMTENLPVIEIHDLHKSYDGLDVLKGVDLVAHEGTVVTLIGASGSCLLYTSPSPRDA